MRLAMLWASADMAICMHSLPPTVLFALQALTEEEIQQLAAAFEVRIHMTGDVLASACAAGSAALALIASGACIALPPSCTLPEGTRLPAQQVGRILCIPSSPCLHGLGVMQSGRAWSNRSLHSVAADCYFLRDAAYPRNIYELPA